MIEINKLVESNNLKSAITLKKSFQPRFEYLKRYAKIDLVISKFEERFQQDMNTQSLDFLIKNIKKVFEFLPKFSSIVSFSIKNNSKIEKIENTAMLELFSETVDLLKTIGNYQKHKNVFYDRFLEYLEKGILKNIEPKNLSEKTVDIFCFFVTYNSFKTQIFCSEIPDIILSQIDAHFIEKMKVLL